MFYEFYKWCTYNPENYDLRRFICAIMFMTIAFSVAYLLILVGFGEKISFKMIIKSILYGGYTLLVLLWSLCFHERNIGILMVPIYPLIAFSLWKLMHYTCKNIKRLLRYGSLQAKIRQMGGMLKGRMVLPIRKIDTERAA